MRKLLTWSSRLAVVPLALTLAACDNPVGEGGEHPVGLVVVGENDVEVARRTAAGQTTSEITIGTTSTHTFEVFALSSAGTRIDIDGEELALTVTDPRPGFTATLQGTNQIVLGAGTAGTFDLGLTLYHEGHPEFNAVFEVTAHEATTE